VSDREEGALGAPVLEAPDSGSVKAKDAGPSWLVRAVPGLLLGSALVVMAAGVLVASRSTVHPRVSKQVSIGPFDVLLVYSTPSPMLVISGLLTAVALVALVAGLDAWAAKRVTNPARRGRDAAVRPLRSEATLTRPPGPISVTALIPARNEAQHIAATLRSLRAQTTPPTAIWVIADNCTDDTAEVARANGANVYTTVENRHRKAGGLNQLLARLLPTFGPLDAVLVMDADTVMVENFLEQAVAEFDALSELDAVGGVFVGDDSPGLLSQLQRNEYLRYGREISRRQGRVFVLTGTASVFRADALAAVAAARGTVLPGVVGQVYDTYSLTEDNELTLALKTLGAGMVSPRACRVRTELMPTWRDLWRQRQRWQRGALENIGMYGLSSATARYWSQQLALGYGVIALAAYLTVTVLAYIAFGVFTIVVFWVLLGALFAVERTVTVWPGGWRARLLAAPLLIELGYAMVLQLVYVKSMLDIVLGRSKHWNAAVVAAPAP
jgi:cellulose synthase/poly-beta-1,6-N-acetylglucosamine synthase-like glycosyltransferase